MKKLIPIFVVLAAGIANAEWKLNPYTQRQDYYESKAAVVLSTGTLQVEIDALHVATTTLTQNLATEVSDRTIADAAIAVSTGTLTTGLATEISARQAADLVIGLTTASLRSDLTAEANNRIAGDSAVGASTGTLGVRVTAAEAALSTAAYTTASYANPAWITSLAISKIDLSTVTTALAGKENADATIVKEADLTANDFNVAAGVVSLDYTNGQAAGAGAKGFLTSTDWSTFNGKQAAGNYITALTGDVTASGPGSVVATVANDSHLHNLPTLVGIRASTDTLAGDVTGTYGATVVGDNSHAHNQTTVTGVIYSTATGIYGISITGNAATATTTTGNSATATKLATARAINGVSFDGSANINIATTSYLADGVSLALTGATFSAKSSSVTLQGNTFNGASQLVRLDGTGRLPAIDGSQLTNFPSTPGGAVLASTQTFTGDNTFTGAVIISSETGPNLIPTGAVISFNLSACPSGWYLADGTNGTPDLRGMFIRGLDSGSGRDPDANRVVGSTQTDTMQEHQHEIAQQFSNPAFGFGTQSYAGGLQYYNSATSGLAVVSSTTWKNTGVRASTETRPENIAFIFCVKR